MRLSPPYGLIREALWKGRVIPFLGAGASSGGRTTETIWRKGQTAYLPTANELASYLAEKMEFPKEEDPALTKVAQYYDVVGGRAALNEELHNIFNCDYPLTPLHSFLADVPAPLLIVTTNYDDCLERAFRAKGRAYDLVIHTTDASYREQLLVWEHAKTEPRYANPKNLDLSLDTLTVIYKMHGAVDRHGSERDQYVITEDDYIDFLTRMTRKRAIPSIFAEPFLTRHFLFLGYGLRDWNLRVLLNRIEKDMRWPKDIKSWAIQYDPSPLEQRFWQERRVEVFNEKLDDFVDQISSRHDA